MKDPLKYLLILAAVFVFGCNPDYIMDQTYDIKETGWTYDNPLNFEVDIKDSLKIYNLYLDIEHSTEYPNQNMYVMIHTAFPSGKKISEKVSLEMANKAGVWYGDCDSEWCKLRVVIQEGAFFNALGKHTFTIEQYMRIDPLPEVKSISFKIENTGQARN